MKPSELAQMIHNLTEKRLGLFAKKSADYATEDALANFKRMNILCKTLDIDTRRSPADCALFLQVLKLDRKCNLRAKGQKPSCEPVLDTILDEHNYIDLGYACEQDNLSKEG